MYALMCMCVGPPFSDMLQDSRQVAPQDSRQVAPTPGAASVEVAETAQPRSSQTSGRSSGRSSVRSSQLHVKIKEGTAVNRSKSFKVVAAGARRGISGGT